MRGETNATPLSLYPWERPGTHFIGGWMGPGTSLDECRKSCPYWDMVLGISSSYWVAIPTMLSLPISGYKRFKFQQDISCYNYDSPCAVHKVLLTLQQYVQQRLLFSWACLPHQSSSVPAWSTDNVAMTSHLLDRSYLEEWAESWQIPLSHSQVVSEIQWKVAHFAKSNEIYVYISWFCHRRYCSY